jgi:hypothetical protein
MADLIKLLLYSGPSVLLVAAGLLWGKKVIEYFFDETIEMKKLELSQQLEIHKKHLEQQNKIFQYQLDTKLNEFNIRFSKLHQERAEVIKELFAKLIELHHSMLAFTSTIQIVIINAEKEEEERLKRVNDALNSFNTYFIPNRIFFSIELADKLDKLSKEYWDKGWDYSFLRSQFKEGDLTKEIAREYRKKSTEISEAVQKNLSELLAELESEFRKLLGVD